MRTNEIFTAGSFVVGKSYEIKTVGSTDFTLIGALTNVVGVEFTATGVGSGTGTAYYKYDNLILAKDMTANTGNPIFNNATEIGKGFMTTLTLNSKLQIFYNEATVENFIYDWIMCDLDKDTVFNVRHTFNGSTYSYDAYIKSGARTLLPNDIVLLEFDWIMADI